MPKKIVFALLLKGIYGFFINRFLIVFNGQQDHLNPRISYHNNILFFSSFARNHVWCCTFLHRNY